MVKVERFGAAFALALSAVSSSGCLKATGGGKLTGNIHLGATITTGFQLQCTDLGGYGHVTGEFQYQDHTTNVAFHAVIDQYPLEMTFPPSTQPTALSCGAVDGLLTEDGLQGTFSALGTYTPHPTNLGPGGSVQVVIQGQNNAPYQSICVESNGQPVDALAVQIDPLDNGVYHGYAEITCLDKGNFTVFTE
jgi:hypothetical protein